MPSYWSETAFKGSHSKRIGCPVPIPILFRRRRVPEGGERVA